MGIRCADHMTPLYPQKLALTSPTDGGRSVRIVRSRTKATEFIKMIILGHHVSTLTESSSGPLRYRSKIRCVHNALRDPQRVGNPAMRYGHI